MSGHARSIRREVMCQMLDYAASGSLYWPVDELRAYFEIAHGHPQGVIAELRMTSSNTKRSGLYLAEISGQQVSDRNPAVRTHVLVWAEFVERVLPMYQDARRTAKQAP